MKTSKPPWPAVTRISSFDQKPASGKMPASASEPIMNVKNVIGMYLRRPPMSFFMSKEWCEPEWLTEPAPRKRQRLEERVGEEVEHRADPGADAERPSPCSRAG